MRHFYWERYPGGPFATLIAVATSYLHPEANEPEALRRRAGRDGDPEIRVFKDELREAIQHPDRLPEGELERNVQWHFGASPEVFLRLMWWYLYRDEPPAAPQVADARTGGAEKGDPVRTNSITSSLFEGEWIPAGAEGTVLEALPKGRCLVLLTFIPQAEDETGSYGGNPEDGDFPLAVLRERQYDVVQRQGRE